MLPLEYVLAAVACLVVGRELGSWLFSKRTKVQDAKRSAQDLAIKLREFGLKLIPSLLEDMVVGDVYDMVAKIRDLSLITKAGDDAILKELNSTFERVLVVKLGTPEGRAVVAAELAEAAKVAAAVAV